MSVSRVRALWAHPYRYVFAACVLAATTWSGVTLAASPARKASSRTEGAGAHRSPTARSGDASRKRPRSASVGSPTEGRLVFGVPITEGPHLRMYPAYAGTDVRYGLDAFVAMLDHAARAVRKQFPGAVLTMGQLSKQGGGDVDRHASHESGRDADVGFYVRSAAGKPLAPEHMVPFLGDGTAPTWPGAYFDDAKNWALVAAMLGDRRTHITHIFVATPIRSRLLAHAAKIGAPAALRKRAAEVLRQPRGSLPHDDHFHVRIACPVDMAKCIELPVRKRSRGHVAASRERHGKTGASAPKVGRAADEAARSSASKPAPEASRPTTHDGDEGGVTESEASVPSLAPIVPGLDSVVIPAPLEGVKVPARPRSEAEIIDDPDGILDAR